MENTYEYDEGYYLGYSNELIVEIHSNLMEYAEDMSKRTVRTVDRVYFNGVVYTVEKTCLDYDETTTFFKDHKKAVVICYITTKEDDIKSYIQRLLNNMCSFTNVHESRVIYGHDIVFKLWRVNIRQSTLSAQNHLEKLKEKCAIQSALYKSKQENGLTPAKEVWQEPISI